MLVLVEQRMIKKLSTSSSTRGTLRNMLDCLGEGHRQAELNLPPCSNKLQLMDIDLYLILPILYLISYSILILSSIFLLL